ncbi:hypothetical protein ACIA98_36080 [Streptomyces sp. NPDC051366]|uniref:hypothetical protein n=1 Tax=Streptomyces sp. NPDC051366 TaxID=3365652 RepID=UPI0037A2DAF5
MRQQPEPAAADAVRAYAAKTREEAGRRAAVLEDNAAAPMSETWSGALQLVPLLSVLLDAVSVSRRTGRRLVPTDLRRS